MAQSSYLKSLVGGLDADIKAALTRCFDYLCDGNIRFGPIQHMKRAGNMAGIDLVATTHATANTEFSVEHGLGLAPARIIPTIDPGTVNSRLVGDLTISRAADGRRLYLKSASTNVTFSIYVEGPSA